MWLEVLVLKIVFWSWRDWLVVREGSLTSDGLLLRSLAPLVILRVPEDPLWALEQRLLTLTTRNFDDGVSVMWQTSAVLVLAAAASEADLSEFRPRLAFTYSA